MEEENIEVMQEVTDETREEVFEEIIIEEEQANG
jgi:hypothetical protein